MKLMQFIAKTIAVEVVKELEHSNVKVKSNKKSVLIGKQEPHKETLCIFEDEKRER